MLWGFFLVLERPMAAWAMRSTGVRRAGSESDGRSDLASSCSQPGFTQAA